MSSKTIEQLREQIRELMKASSAIEDRSGRTPLDVMAEVVVAGKIEAANVAQAVTELLTEAPSTDLDELIRLVNFISAAELMLNHRRLNEIVETQLNRPSDVEKRGELLRLQWRLGRKFLPAELEREVAVKSACPWLWFDLMLAAEPNDAAAFALERCRQHGLEPGLEARLVELWRRIDPDEFSRWFVSLTSCLDESELGPLSEMLSEFTISTPGSDQSEYGTNRLKVSLEQKMAYSATLQNLSDNLIKINTV